MTEALEESRPVGLEDFDRVTSRLAEALDAFRKEPENLFILDSVVKRFELTYELAFRNLRRFLLDQAISAPDVDTKSFAGAIRLGDREGLLRSGWPEWREFREWRNETVRAYQEEKARDVAAKAERFLPEAKFLLENLKRRVGADG